MRLPASTFVPESREEDLGRVPVLQCFSLCSSLAFSKAPLWPFGLSPWFLESTVDDCADCALEWSCRHAPSQHPPVNELIGVFRPVR